MEEMFKEKKEKCKTLASKSLLFSVVSEDLSKFVESVDHLEYSEAVENLVDTLINFFSQEKNVVISLAKESN